MMTGAKKRFVYVGTLEFNTFTKSFGLHTLAMDIESGELMLLNTIRDGVNSTFIAIDSNGRFLYEANERLDRGDVLAYKINHVNGMLSKAGELNLPAAGCVHVAVSNDNKHVIVPSCRTSNIVSCKVDPDSGALEVADNLQLEKSPGHEALYPHQAVFDDTGKHIIAPDVGDDKVYIISFDELTGKMKIIHRCPVDAGEGPRHLSLHQNKKWMYVLTEYGKTVYLFDFDSENGSLIQRQKVILFSSPKEQLIKSDGMQGAEIQISPDGRYLFASIRGYQTEDGYDSIVRMEINQKTGVVSNMKVFPCYGLCPRMFEFTPDGRFILVCNQASNQVVSLEYHADTGDIGKLRGKVDITEAAVLKVLDIPLA